MYRKSSAIKFTIKNKTFLKHLFAKVNHKDDYSSVESESKTVRYLFNYKIDASSPQTFNEYLIWIKHNYRNDDWKKAADKLQSKEIVSKLGLGKFVPKVYGVYNSSKDIRLDDLPNEFVLKTNHDCGSVYICKKGTTNFEAVFESLDKSLTRKYNELNREWVYEDIKPRIFAEELLYQDNGGELIDYKFQVYNGVYKWGFACCNRSKDSRFIVFEGDYDIQNTHFIYLRPRKAEYPPKPKHFEEMVKIAEKIGREFPFIRVDFFETTDGIKIGELTFFTQSGHGPFTNKKYDQKYGDYFKETIFYKLAH